MARSFEPGTERDKRIKQACKERGCTLTSFVNEAIDLYLDAGISDDEQNLGQVPSEKRTYYIHGSNPDIKLVDRITQNDQEYFIDTEGRKWGMAADRTLIGIARIVSRG